MIRRVLAALAVRLDTGELRPWAATLLGARRRGRACWQQIIRPRLIRVRARWQRWCRHTRAGRLLCGPLPAPVLLLAHYALAVLVATVGLAAVHLVGLIYCRGAPDPARPLDAEIGALCKPLSPRSRHDTGEQDTEGHGDAPGNRH